MYIVYPDFSGLQGIFFDGNDGFCDVFDEFDGFL